MPVRRVDMSAARWRKSRYSNGGGGACVEVADNLPGAVPVRDSKTPHRATLVFEPAAWSSFVTAVRSGEFASPARG
ncbi:DUF397 domain-containing protein [Streptomyces sp. TRM49041]|uniref:DUF397 domain-containing protein n=1 Tax=Streptomyces sp. TRM49041 TaxID=2603216 RepID=UPI0021CC51B6|nr:DUF397 domain-containing protein [Streptomyces sp. TRM49041]